MRIDVSKFGTTLLSRPKGREDALALKANVLHELKNEEDIELDYSKVSVLTPSWASEFIGFLKEQYGDRVKNLPSDNPTVQLTLETIGEKVSA